MSVLFRDFQSIVVAGEAAGADGAAGWRGVKVTQRMEAEGAERSELVWDDAWVCMDESEWKETAVGEGGWGVGVLKPKGEEGGRWQELRWGLIKKNLD